MGRGMKVISSGCSVFHIPSGKLLVLNLLADTGGAYQTIILTPLAWEFAIALQ
jgi:hypothetical protein